MPGTGFLVPIVVIVRGEKRVKDGLLSPLS
jgi:hypothetical protein